MWYTILLGCLCSSVIYVIKKWANKFCYLQYVDLTYHLLFLIVQGQLLRLDAHSIRTKTNQNYLQTSDFVYKDCYSYISYPTGLLNYAYNHKSSSSVTTCLPLFAAKKQFCCPPSSTIFVLMTRSETFTVILN